MKRKLVISISLVVIAAAVYLVPARPEAEKSGASAPAERYAAAEGKIEILPGYEVEVGSEVEGRIELFPVKEGDRIEKGQLLAMLANGDIKARLREAEAALGVAKARLKETASGFRIEEIREAAAEAESARAKSSFARANLERYRELFGKGYIPREQLDEKERDLRVAESELKRAEEEKTLREKGPKAETLRLLEEEEGRTEADMVYYRRLLDKTYITAPIAGKVIRKYLEQGEGITKDKTLAAVADTDRIRVNAEVDETDIGMVNLGDSAEVRSDAFEGKTFRGEVEEIADYAGRRSVTPNDQSKNIDMKVVQVKIALKEKTPLKPGMTVDVRIRPLQAK